MYRRQFVMRFQQLTGPVMAKGVEDTAFYRHYPLASLNEVGMDPLSFGTTREVFHQKNQERLEKWPHTMLTTFTHDTKRSEDVRARINVLSERAEEWEQALFRWHDLNQKYRTTLPDGRAVPDKNEEYLLYQTLIGTWPLYPLDAEARVNYINRIEQYLLKALKEAKIHTSWINPNEVYEKGVIEFIRHLLNLEPDNHFLKDFEAFIQPIVKAGMFNSLAQTLLKMTTPGIPDFYQGSVLWEFTLVDPDNRRPVDYSNRKHLLGMLKQKAEQDPTALLSHLMETPEDGRIKLYLIFRVLNFRRQHLALFQEGNYVPLEAKGEKARHVVAFSRKKGERVILVMVGRFYHQLADDRSFVDPTGEIWKDTFVVVPAELQGHYRDILRGVIVEVTPTQGVRLQEAFSKLPLVLLEKVFANKEP
jgi:(1->4)-alpha-D-glucan 1-alpha-D-glucosylmutase